MAGSPDPSLLYLTSILQGSTPAPPSHFVSATFVLDSANVPVWDLLLEAVSKQRHGAGVQGVRLAACGLGDGEIERFAAAVSTNTCLQAVELQSECALETLHFIPLALC